MAHTPNPFEDHTISVVTGAEACALAWLKLAELGIADEDVGVVMSGDAAPAALAKSRALVPVDTGRHLLHASCGYPADLLAQSANSDGRWSFDGLLSEREGRALTDAILTAGASLWVRTRSPDIASRVAELLLRMSAERVRTFSRPAAPPRLDRDNQSRRTS